MRCEINFFRRSFFHFAYIYYICDSGFWGRFSCYRCDNFQEGNTLAATAFVRLLEVSGSVTVNRSSERQKIHSCLSPTVEYSRIQNVTKTGLWYPASHHRGRTCSSRTIDGFTLIVASWVIRARL